MSRTVISVKNISIAVLFIRDLNSSTIPIGETYELSDSNSYDHILSSVDLHDYITNDKAVLVINGEELSKNNSLSWMDIYSSIGANFIVKKITNADSPYNASKKELLWVDCTDGDVVVKLPDASTWEGLKIKVKKIVTDLSPNKIKIEAFTAQKVENESFIYILESGVSLTLMSDGSESILV